VRFYELTEAERSGIIAQKGEQNFIEAASKSRKKEIQMNGKIMKLSVLVGVAVIALFMMVGIASAHPPFPYYINGVFAVTGVSSCSPDGSTSPVSPGIFEGDYTFRPEGTVSVSNGFVRNLPGQGPTMAVRGAFKYIVTRAGRIEFQYPEGGFEFGTVDESTGIFSPSGSANLGPSHGVISQDGNTITITCGPPAGPLYQRDLDGNRASPDLWCVTTYTGIRIR
jgi:hypothetical protein